jgi:hypothetical protein
LHVSDEKVHFHHCQKLYRHFQCRVNHSGDAGARLISACPQPKRGRGKLERRRRFTRRTRRRGESQKEKRNIGTNRILPRITIYLCRLRNGEGTTPLGLTGSLGESTQGSLARSATLGWRAQSLWDWVDGRETKNRLGSWSQCMRKTETGPAISQGGPDSRLWAGIRFLIGRQSCVCGSDSLALGESAACRPAMASRLAAGTVGALINLRC